MNWIVLIWLLAVTQISINHVYCFSRDREYLDSMEGLISNPYFEDLRPMAVKRYIRFGKRIPKHQERSSRSELMELTGQPTEFIRFG
ncbi:hypothetical protein CRM22_010517 [Opisthorchis felineus]|uniref:Uncharacterized protein n=1 Tax=Opisthorchis felineus TaxID=147828 RepID=A0A4S2KYA0_OPIFE|nr:hypothetical protein CRM22_010517 [Opisthorchis felineus]